MSIDYDLFSDEKNMLLMKPFITRLTISLFLVFGIANYAMAQSPCEPGADIENPVITCTADIENLSCDVIPEGYTDSLAYVTAYPAATLTDNCQIESLSFFDDPDPTTFTFCDADGPFVVTRTYTAIDIAGNSAMCSFTYSYLSDMEGPVFTAPDNIMADQGFTCGNSTDPYDVEQNYPGEGLPTITDNCGGGVSAAELAALPEVMDGWTEGEVVNYNGYSFAYSQSVVAHPLGVCSEDFQRKYRIIRIWSAIDPCDNETTYEHRINVVDGPTPPIVGLVPGDLDFFVDDNCEVTILPSDVELGSTDACVDDPLIPFTFDVSATALIRVEGVGDFVDELVIDNSSNDGSPLSLSIEVMVSDSCGNTATDSKLVTILDTFPPTIMDCPEDTIIQLDSLQCTAVFEWADPTATDNCDEELLVERTDNSGVNSGDEFPIGVTTISYEAVDSSGNISVCSFDVEILEYENETTACVEHINFSIDENCFGQLTPSMVLTGEGYGCLDSCDINTMTLGGEEIPNSFDFSHVGNTYMYEVCCNGVCCMGTFTVEDKFTPQIMCEPDTITCMEMIVLPPPVVIDNCDMPPPVLIGQTIEDVSCTDTLLDHIITRQWIATDLSGNVSDTCTQVLSIAKFNIDSIQPPAMSSVVLECGSNYPTDDEGNPDPEFFGSPRLNGVNLFPDQFLPCNTMVAYSDKVLNYGDKVFVERTWTATVWNCSGDQDKDFYQLFTIQDTEGPVAECIDDFSQSVSTNSCTASVVLPEIDAFDVCNEVTSVDISWDGGFIDNMNGAVVVLPVGTTTITYTFFDTYKNTSTCEFDVTIFDNVQPIAIAEGYTVVELTTDGTATLFATNVDDGSFDECSDIQMYIKRMDNGASCDPVDNYPPNGNDNAQFNDAVHFCCADIGAPIMVQFRVCDDADMDGDFGTAGDLCANVMVEVEVQDNIPPALIEGLPDITISCEYPIDFDNLTVFGEIVTDIADRDTIKLTADYVEFSNNPPLDALIYDNCGDLISDEITNISNLNNCGTGTVLRVLQYGDSNNTFNLFQNITIVNPSPFNEGDAVWPSDYEAFTNEGTCGIDQLLPQNLPAGFDYPIITEDNCDMVDYTYEEEVFIQSPGSEGCVVIERTWYVADWCQLQSDGTYLEFEYLQTLTLNNLIDPVIDGDCSDRFYESLDPDCGEHLVSLGNSATDDCTLEGDLDWDYTIDEFIDGSINHFGSSDTFDQFLPIGTHLVTWTVNDGCGNTATCSYEVEITNIKAPVAVCLDNLVFELTPTDSDDDGTLDTEMTIVHAEMINKGSYQSCDYPLVFSFSSDTTETIVVFDCDDIGDQVLEMWVTETVNGNQALCITTVQVQDNNDEDICPEPIMSQVSGNVYTEGNEMVQDVVIDMGITEKVDVTDENGKYSFSDIPTGMDYTVTPGYDKDPLNGVTTLDIIMIQKHILGLQEIESPYQKIAADISADGKISGSDIVQIRKLILGLYNNFPNNTSWRFVDAGHQWVDPSDPFVSEFPEEYNIIDLNGDMAIDFYGIKIGDINGSATTNVNSNSIENRSNKVMDLIVPSIYSKEGEQVSIPVKAGSFEDVQGFQFSLQYDTEKIEVLGLQSENIDMVDHFSINDGVVTISWNENDPVSVDDLDLLFSIQAISKIEINNEDLFALDNQLQAEMYDKDLQVADINIVSESITSIEELDGFNHLFEVKQNNPNPWSTSTSIQIQSSVNETAFIRIMDMTGRTILQRQLHVTRGENSLIVNANEIHSTGVLYYEVTIGDQTTMNKMVHIK